MNVQSNELVGRWIKWAAQHDRREMLNDMWLLSDYIGGLNVDLRKVQNIINKMDQSKKDVKNLRRELGL